MFFVNMSFLSSVVINSKDDIIALLKIVGNEKRVERSTIENIWFEISLLNSKAKLYNFLSLLKMSKNL